MRLPIDPFTDDLPTWDPVMFAEATDDGWRGLTADGEVLDVHGTNGHKIAIPDSILVHH